MYRSVTYLQESQPAQPVGGKKTKTKKSSSTIKTCNKRMQKLVEQEGYNKNMSTLHGCELVM
jgi:hypothetical protein